MKLNVTVEIDWMDENGGNIDSIVQNRIAQHVFEKISEESTNSLVIKAEELINARAKTMVDEVFKGIMNQPIVITDGWGNTKKSYGNAEEMIKERFDKYITERVDNQGNTSSYGDGSTRMDFIVRKQLEKLSKEFTQSAVKEVAEKIKATLSDDLKVALGDRMLNMMELDKVITTKKLSQ